MFIRSTCSLGLMAFNRPISILARPCNVPRVKAALARLGMHIHTHPTRLFHSSIRKLQQDRVKDIPSSKPSSTETALSPPSPEKQVPTQAKPPTDLETERYITGFSDLSLDAKLVQIHAFQNYLATEGRKNDPARKALTELLSRKEKEIQDADRRYKKAFRSIAWGPTILINAIISLFLW